MINQIKYQNHIHITINLHHNASNNIPEITNDHKHMHPKFKIKTQQAKLRIQLETTTTKKQIILTMINQIQNESK